MISTTRPRPTSAPRSPAAPTSGCGSSRRIPRRGAELPRVSLLESRERFAVGVHQLEDAVVDPVTPRGRERAEELGLGLQRGAGHLGRDQGSEAERAVARLIAAGDPIAAARAGDVLLARIELDPGLVLAFGHDTVFVAA